MKLALMFTAIALAAEPLLVDVNWLATHLNDHGLVILHVGPKPDYLTAHIPGARHITLEDIALGMDRKNPAELTLELPPPEELRKRLAAFGISSDSRIIVYFAAKTALQSSTRVVFTLDYIGLGDHTSLLNGGLPAWTAAGKTVTAEVASITPGNFTPRPVKNLVADADFVKSVSKRPNHKLIDARLPEFYKGTQPTYEKSGHIPGAINLPFAELLDENLAFNKERLSTLFKTAGVNPGDTVVAYCHIGQQATAVIFAARLLNHPVMLYDGSFQDWSTNSRGPVEK